MTFHSARLTLSDLAELSPWTYEQLAGLGPETVEAAVREAAHNDNPAQPLQIWVRAAERCHSVLWRAIDAQG
ncbi:hypothetical protein ACFSX5_01060 [Devosia albogilva]|uniref:Uncharacterized protein n=1 Tax=Devosia albogilva TaxID=429726 RepID=A0ABW5QF16_9HYPH